MARAVGAEQVSRRRVRLQVLGSSTARCEKCLADTSKQIDTWIVHGVCNGCLKSDQQKRAGR